MKAKMTVLFHQEAHDRSDFQLDPHYNRLYVELRKWECTDTVNRVIHTDIKTVGESRQAISTAVCGPDHAAIRDAIACFDRYLAEHPNLSIEDINNA